MTAEELLQNTEDSELHEASNEVFVIDNDLRTIFVPESISNIGVESDDDVNRLYFQMPKQYGEFDLSEFDIRINYMNADNKGDIYAVTDKEVPGDNITFSWLVGRTAFAKKGNVRFIVCLKKTDDEGRVQKEFNTTVATLAVLEGLETSEQIVQENPDIIEEILKRLDTLETTGGGGTPGKDGREIEIQNNGTAIQWRYVGDESWTDLVQLSDLKGQKGDPGDNGITPTIGENGNWYLGETDTGKPSRGGKGDPGQTGATPNIQIGTVQTLEPGQQATASMTGTPENPLLNLGIPKGEKGDPGEDAGGGDYTLPVMSSTQLGGGKAVEKTDEDVPVAVDPETGQLFVPTYPENTGGSADIPRQQMKNTDTTVTLEPNKLYIFPEMASLTVTLGTPNDTNVANEYHFFFTSGATATTLTLNDVLADAYSIEANIKYEVSILEGVAYIKGVATDAA